MTFENNQDEENQKNLKSTFILLARNARKINPFDKIKQSLNIKLSPSKSFIISIAYSRSAINF